MSGMPTANAASFTVEEAVQATGARLLQNGSAPAQGVTTDSRAALVGKIFVALRGEHFDGHRFVQDAVERGAAMVVVDAVGASDLDLGALPPKTSVLETQDSTRALGDLARFHRQRWGGTLVAIAGSAGKTTTRSLVSQTLELLRPGQVLSTEANFNNRIGVALTLLRLQAAHGLCVLELGTNTKGEVAELARIARPNLGVLTLIDLEHTEGLGDLDGVEEEEGALFAALPENGTAIGFGDDPRVLRQLGRSPARTKVAYGRSSSQDVRVTGMALESDLSTRISLDLGPRFLSVRSTLAGTAGALAAAAACCVAEALCPGELEAEQLEEALRRASVPGRATLLPLEGGALVVDDTYNANPASVRLAIDLGRQLAEQRGGRLIVVFGDMLELGHEGPSAHREVGSWAMDAGVDLFFTVGVLAAGAQGLFQPRSPDDSRHFSHASEVGVVLAPLLRPRDVVLVKASRGVRAEQIVRYLQDPGLDGPPGKGTS